MRSIMACSAGVLPEMASASRTLASASRALPALSSSLACCSGLPTSGRTCADAVAMKPAAIRATDNARRGFIDEFLGALKRRTGIGCERDPRIGQHRVLSVHELLVAHEADLGHAQSLGAGH